MYVSNSDLEELFLGTPVWAERSRLKVRVRRVKKYAFEVGHEVGGGAAGPLGLLVGIDRFAALAGLVAAPDDDEGPPPTYGSRAPWRAAQTRERASTWSG